jgi:hypothetical protein
MQQVKKQRKNKRNLLLEIWRAENELTLIFHAPGEVPYFMKPYMNGEQLDEEKFYRVIKDLTKKELIKTTPQVGGITIHLTTKGEKKALKFSLDELKIQRPEKWDGVWRMVVFDIPDEKKVARNYFKIKLDQLGFVTIQKSIYAHPFPCEEEIKLIRSVYEIDGFVKILKVAHFEGEERFLAKFGLGRERVLV